MYQYFRRLMCVLGSALAAGAVSAQDTNLIEAPVSANAYPPTFTGLNLTVGQSAIVFSEGEWSVGGPYGLFDGEGSVSQPTESCAVSTDFPMGALLGTVTNGTTWFKIGIGPLAVSGPGSLYVIANDCVNVCGSPGGCYVDNQGELMVTIRRIPSSIDNCRFGEWVSFVDSKGNPFRNQGQCIRFVKKASRHRD